MTDEELIERLRDADLYNAQHYERDPLHKQAADRIEAIEAKLATCEKYRDAYAECDRIGTQTVRDLEAKLAKAVEALRETTQMLSQCTFTIIRMKGQYFDRHEVIDKANAVLAELEGKE